MCAPSRHLAREFHSPVQMLEGCPTRSRSRDICLAVDFQLVAPMDLALIAGYYYSHSLAVYPLDAIDADATHTFVPPARFDFVERPGVASDNIQHSDRSCGIVVQSGYLRRGNRIRSNFWARSVHERLHRRTGYTCRTENAMKKNTNLIEIHIVCGRITYHLTIAVDPW